jgi:exosortase A-associated hydrolase 2
MEPFFLAAGRGVRFCIFHPPAGEPRATLLYLHPFAEEMNKSRRMAALQSRMLAAAGCAVLQVDLYGCGDSSGDFSEARWEIWKDDVALGLEWMRRRLAMPVHLSGLRLGALLALDYATGTDEDIAGLVLVQPLVSGESFLTQFLRLRVASEMMYAGTSKTGTQQLRGELARGRVVEVAGYGLAPELAQAIDRLKLEPLAPRRLPVHWLEVVRDADADFPPAAREVMSAWGAGGVKIHARKVVGPAFWNTIQITECHDLCRETVRLFS